MEVGIALKGGLGHFADLGGGGGGGGGVPLSMFYKQDLLE